MSDNNVDDLIIEHLKGLRSDIAAMKNEMRQKFKDVKQRLNSIESGITSIKMRHH